MFSENGLSKINNRSRLASVVNIKSAVFIPLKSMIYYLLLVVVRAVSENCHVGAGSRKICFHPMKLLLPQCKVTAADLHQHENGPQDILWQCSTHNVAWGASRCHWNWITFHFILNLNVLSQHTVIYVQIRNLRKSSHVLGAGHTFVCIQCEFGFVVVLATSFGIFRGHVLCCNIMAAYYCFLCFSLFHFSHGCEMAIGMTMSADCWVHNFNPLAAV